ncbi:hypothetical protein GLE_3175 [Lysobacter enzymogenes]|uniref:Uncharacterized protein n=1 Tax=Lysobacter enzymogenes TaxID=69 RepID=A0A0S2DJC2_LYSEN|nr:hypothetical protein GLE_3175 [Lysobacter enzymogenes]
MERRRGSDGAIHARDGPDWLPDEREGTSGAAPRPMSGRAAAISSPAAAARAQS